MGFCLDENVVFIVLLVFCCLLNLVIMKGLLIDEINYIDDNF